MRILLGVTGGIAAYKAVSLLRLLQKDGHEIRVVMTPAAAEFVTPLTFQALTEQRVWVDEFRPDVSTSKEALSHIELAKWPDLIVIAPATANTIAKMSAGIADNLLTSALLAATSPVVVCPAMNNNMFTHASTQANLNTLRERGIDVMQPAVGHLACGDDAVGKLPEPEEIAGYLRKYTTKGDMAGIKVLITAGPTVEPIDPVRYVSNYSSGKMGYAIAAQAQARGADVTLISGPTALQPPVANVINVLSASDMYEAASKEVENCDILIMAAAVADYTPDKKADQKIKKCESALRIDLKPTIDILKTVSVSKKQEQVFVGFAAESEKLYEHAEKKLKAKKLDMIVANDISRCDIGFNSNENEVTFIYHTLEKEHFQKSLKSEVADAVLNRALKLFKAKN